jgi:hypothetical protein
MRLNHPLKEEYLQLKSAISLRVWLFKQNQLPAIGKWMDKHSQTAVIATCLVAGGFCAGLIASENEMISRSESVRLDGMSDGAKLAEYDFKGAIKREMFKAEKVAYCMGFWFKEDTDFVGKALQAVKVSK